MKIQNPKFKLAEKIRQKLRYLQNPHEAQIYNEYRKKYRESRSRLSHSGSGSRQKSQGQRQRKSHETHSSKDLMLPDFQKLNDVIRNNIRNEAMIIEEHKFIPKFIKKSYSREQSDKHRRMSNSNKRMSYFSRQNIPSRQSRPSRTSRQSKTRKTSRTSRTSRTSSHKMNSRHSMSHFDLQKSMKKHRNRSRSRSRSNSNKKETQNNSKISNSRSNSRRSNSRRSNSRSKSLSRDKKEVVIKPLENDYNPITFLPYSETYWKKQETVINLPVNEPKVKAKLRSLLDHHSILLLTADTGAGKTTQIPKQVWEYFDYLGTVVCTQPTTVNVMDMAKRVADEMDLELGNQIWFKYQESDEKAGINLIGGLQKLFFITDGSMVNLLMKNPNAIFTYDAFIIDEAHERNVNMDLLLWFMKTALKNPLCRTKFIIMSATIDKEVFLDYFKSDGIVHYHISGRTFPVEVVYSPDNKPLFSNLGAFKSLNDKILASIVDKVDMIFRQNLSMSKSPMGDMIIFLPTVSLINKTIVELNKMLEDRKYSNYKVLGCYAELIGRDVGYKNLITEPISGITKIIVSTNVAETGITINGAYYAIDTGLSLNEYYDPFKRERILDTNSIDASAANQRKGRVGRNMSGVCYRLYSEAEFKKFPSGKKSKIEVQNLESFLLTLIQFRNYVPEGPEVAVRQILSEMITVPDSAIIDAYMNYFRKLGLFELQEDIGLEKPYETLSSLGKCINGFNLDLRLSLSLITGLSYEVDPILMCDFIALMNRPYHEYFISPRTLVAEENVVDGKVLDGKVLDKKVLDIDKSELRDEVKSEPKVRDTQKRLMDEYKYEKIAGDLGIDIKEFEHDLGEVERMGGFQLELRPTKTNLNYIIGGYQLDEIDRVVSGKLVLKKNSGGVEDPIKEFEQFRKHYVNPYGDIFGLHFIFLDYVEKKIPLKYIKFLNLNNLMEAEIFSMKKLYESKPLATMMCWTTGRPPKYRIRDDMYKNILATFKEVYGEDNVLEKSGLDFKKLLKDGNHFYDFKADKVFYTSKISLTSFGEPVSETFGNFLNFDLIKD